MFPRQCPDVPQPEKDVVYLIDRPGSGQSLILAAQLAPPFNNPDQIPLMLVNDIFGGNFSSRINMNLREDKHWSYGVGSRLIPARGQRPFVSFSPVQTDKTKESMEVLIDEYKDIVGGKPITGPELKDEQSNATLALPGSFETTQQLSRRLRQHPPIQFAGKLLQHLHPKSPGRNSNRSQRSSKKIHRTKPPSLGGSRRHVQKARSRHSLPEHRRSPQNRPRRQPHPITNTPPPNRTPSQGHDKCVAPTQMAGSGGSLDPCFPRVRLAIPLDHKKNRHPELSEGPPGCPTLSALCERSTDCNATSTPTPAMMQRSPHAALRARVGVSQHNIPVILKTPPTRRRHHFHQAPHRIPQFRLHLRGPRFHLCQLRRIARFCKIKSAAPDSSSTIRDFFSIRGRQQIAPCSVADGIRFFLFQFSAGHTG